MQPLPATSKQASPMGCAWEMLDAVPPMMWYIRRVMRSHRKGLSMPQFRAMVLVANEPDVSLSAVAEHLALALPTASRIVTGLVKKGFLRRQDSTADRRQLSLGITCRGQAVLNAAWAATQQSMAAEVAPFTKEQRAAIAEAMQTIKQIFGSLGLPKKNAG